jgi:hypothetical protein
VGHHGSTNATPVAAVDAMGDGFVAMCSTQEDVYGHVKNDSEVPRGPLLEALEQKCALVRSDQIAVEVDGSVVPAGDGAGPVPKSRSGEIRTGPCYIDYYL